MQLSQQVILLDQAKRLKELGVDAPFIFLHYEFDGKVGIAYSKGLTLSTEYPAYTVAELGEMLPMEVATCKSNDSSYWTASVASPICYDLDSFNWKNWATEAEARADLLIYLIENNHITAASVNEAGKK